MSYLTDLKKKFEVASEDDDELYYIQPDGTYSCEKDGRTIGVRKADLPEGAEIAFNTSYGGGGNNPLDIKTTEPQTKMALDRIQKWAKTKGFTYKRSIQSAMFMSCWYLGPATRFTRPSFEIDGWHGTGKGNRNYGDSAFIFTIYGQEPMKQKFDIYSSINLGSDGMVNTFKSLSEKNLYLANLKRMVDQVTSGQIDTLWM